VYGLAPRLKEQSLLGMVFALFCISFLAASIPAVVLGGVVYLFDETAALYTATAVFVWKFFDFVKLSIHYVTTDEDEKG
jgi:hypothetical protein